MPSCCFGCEIQPNFRQSQQINHVSRLLVGDLRETDRFASELSTVTRVIHTATAWGDPERAHQVNVVAVKRMLALLNPAVVEQIIYFSTASILDRSLQPLQEALAYGTEYIQTKAQCLGELEQHPLAERIVAVFPNTGIRRKGRWNKSLPDQLPNGRLSGSKQMVMARSLAESRCQLPFHPCC